VKNSKWQGFNIKDKGQGTMDGWTAPMTEYLTDENAIAQWPEESQQSNWSDSP
jgi:hypothetical protein